jgi:hypothetical protein
MTKKCLINRKSISKTHKSNLFLSFKILSGIIRIDKPLNIRHKKQLFLQLIVYCWNYLTANESKTVFNDFKNTSK